MFENPRRGRQTRNFTTNAPKILDLKSSPNRYFPENCRWVPLNIVRVSGVFDLSELKLTRLYCIYSKFSDAFCWRDTVAYERLLQKKKNAPLAALKWKKSVQPPDWWHEKFDLPKHPSINDTRPVAYFKIVAFILLIQHILGNSMCVHIAVIKQNNNNKKKLKKKTLWICLLPIINKLNTITVNAHARASEMSRVQKTIPHGKPV